MLEIIKGDLLEAKEKYIGHQCNSISRQAAGLAYHLFQKFPYANIYKDRPHTSDMMPLKPIEKHLPGTIHIRGDGKDKRFVINMIAQVFPGAPFNEHSSQDGLAAREGYFRRCLFSIAAIPNIESLAFPVGIGCNLAGGDWTNYQYLLERFATKLNELQKVKVALYKKD